MNDSSTAQRRAQRKFIVGNIPVKEVIGLVVGLICLVAAIVIALAVPDLRGFGEFTVRLLASLGVALGCMALTGFVEIEGHLLPFKVRAGGALAIFAAVMWINPASYAVVRQPLPVPSDDPVGIARLGLEMWEAHDWAGLDNAAEPRCLQGMKYSELPDVMRLTPLAVGKPVNREYFKATPSVFPVAPNDPMRLIIFEENRTTGPKLYSAVSLLATGEPSKPIWKVCGLTYGTPTPTPQQTYPAP